MNTKITFEKGSESRTFILAGYSPEWSVKRSVEWGKTAEYASKLGWKKFSIECTVEATTATFEQVREGIKQ